MKIYIYTPTIGNGGACLVQAEIVPGKYEYRVHHPEAGYSVWPTDSFLAQHRPLTRREAQLVNHTVAELEVMAISDHGGEYNVLDGSLALVDGRKI
jgi:hypothetical protein